MGYDKQCQSDVAGVKDVRVTHDRVIKQTATKSGPYVSGVAQGKDNMTNGHHDPDDFDAKRWIHDRAFPEQYGPDRRTQLKNRLRSAGFLRIKVVQVIEHHDGAWAIKMYTDAKSEKLTRDTVCQRLNTISKDLGCRIQHGSCEVVIRGRKVEASFVLKPLIGVKNGRRKVRKQTAP